VLADKRTVIHRLDLSHILSRHQTHTPALIAEKVAPILHRLGMRDRVDLTRYAIRRGLIEP
jgi:hypothetical protein